ncbi:MAG: hypothetical protein WCT02_02970 [Candidatus Paceibacterota bacterium]|jgi:hypothetical protein
MQKIIIFKHGGGELANQLWNYISVYAWSLEEKALLSNPSFYEYHSQFTLLHKEAWPVKILARFFGDYRGRKQNFWKKTWRNMYSIYTKLTEIFKGAAIISSENSTNQVTYLPPTSNRSELKSSTLNSSKVYMSGWLFRNPVGLEKYRKEILENFAPKAVIVNRIDSLAADLRKKYSKVIGIHIRQWDYKTWKGGKYWIEQKRIREIINQYAKLNNLSLASTVFLIMSDGSIETECFKGLNIHISKENAVTDLFLLSKTDVVIGSDSSFGHLASWLGNIPHIVLKNEDIDWEYYKDKKKYFQNKYCTMVHF